ncbi:MAG: bifunctional glutamate N-acetyltransferase/amino-acid acetyltransferase ArgJ [Oscillospiraceae bacterium]|nr:bifunctional glutamate N-acetyltransferase/amino-acid acetyltransferase ArgJ [Oscillospiraceae bacterium]
MEIISGGVCAAKGFKASGIHCGIRKNKTKKDLALIVSDNTAAAAAVYTQNLVKGAPLQVTMRHLENGQAKAIICNSGNANTCNADGEQVAEATCCALGEAIGVDANDIVVASTGVIGLPMSIEPIVNGLGDLCAGLSDDGSSDAAQAIMTTDTVQKEIAVSFDIDGIECRIGGIAKGSGMIHPNMATMLVFVTTDAAISSELLQKALSEDIKDSFNMVSVDGDTSTNDMVCVLANGAAGNAEITEDSQDYEMFKTALATVTRYLCREIAKDGEGATKLIECSVTGASTKDIARVAAKSVICSSLVKSAMFGADANWGRVLCALGYAGVDIDVSKINVSFVSQAGEIEVCKNGAGVDFSEEKAKEILLKDEITIKVALNCGDESAKAWGCDLTYDYVRINGDYRT